jgi:Domain of unknown function (DUF4389)
VIDQPVYDVDFVEKRSRLSTFFRYFLAIPHFIVLAVWGFVAYIAVFVAWFAIVFTGRYPAGIYAFVYGFTRYSAAVSAYFYLLTDAYPPFGPDVAGYPAQLKFPPEPLPEYDRLKTLFRIILVIPPAIIAYAMSIVAGIGAFLAWVLIVVTGKQNQGLQDFTLLGLSYQARLLPYYTLMTESWPSFTNPEGGALTGPPTTPGGSGLPPAPATSPVPAAPEAPRGGGLSGGDPLNG